MKIFKWPPEFITKFKDPTMSKEILINEEECWTYSTKSQDNILYCEQSRILTLTKEACPFALIPWGLTSEPA